MAKNNNKLQRNFQSIDREPSLAKEPSQRGNANFSWTGIVIGAVLLLILGFFVIPGDKDGSSKNRKSVLGKFFPSRIDFAKDFDEEKFNAQFSDSNNNNANPAITAMIKNAMYKFTHPEGTKYGSSRLPVRLLLTGNSMSAVPDEVAARNKISEFINSQLVPYLPCLKFKSDPNRLCVTFLTRQQRYNPNSFTMAANPDPEEGSSGCKCKIIVDADVAETMPKVSTEMYKSLFEAGYALAGDYDEQYVRKVQASKLSEVVMFIAATPGKKSAEEAGLHSRTVQMFNIIYEKEF